jgi:SRSO17 transposase
MEEISGALPPKTELARAMLLRALAAGVQARWVTGDSIYGESARLRRSLEERGQGYVFTVTGKTYVCQGWTPWAVRDLLAALATDPQTPWRRLSAGAGSPGPRESDWVAQPINTPTNLVGQRYLLVRRALKDRALTAYLVFALHPVSLADLALAAGARWAIERCFQETKSPLGLDQYEVRTGHGWYRHITLVMAAYAFLITRRQRLLKKNLHHQINRPLSPLPWPICVAGSASPPSPDADSAKGKPSAGSTGVTAISESLSTITGDGGNTHRTAPSPSH